MKVKETAKKPRTGRSKILLQIAALLTVVMIASGAATFLIVRGSQQNLIENSKDKVVQTEILNISSFFKYAASTIAPVAVRKSLDMDLDEHLKHIAAGTLSEVQEYSVAQFKEMAASDAMGIETFMLIMVEWKYIPFHFVYACSDESLIYAWDVPDYLLDAVGERLPYLYMEEGIPELGLDKEYLIVLETVEDRELGYTAALVGIKPMAAEIASINGFFDEESSSINLSLGLVVGSSIFLVLLITFFVMGFLIRKRITEPIEELAASAEEVMMGNLDVEIRVREGSDFEGLVRAFKEMMDSLRRMIERSTGG